MSGRTLHVKCATWEQVEVFHTRKLRGGKLLSMRVPFQANAGTEVTLGLELPNDVMIAIEGTVQKASPIEGDTKTWIEVELHGFTEEVVARIRAMAAEVQAPALAPAQEKPASERRKRPSSITPTPTEDLPADERQLFQQLTAELRRMRQLSVHEVLGVERDADPETIRQGWMALVRRHHPDLIARRNAPAISHLAEELTILCNRAYDRLRAAIVLDGRGTSVGATVRPLPGWLVGLEDIEHSEGHNPRTGNGKQRVTVPPIAAAPVSSALLATAQGGDTFESRARSMLGDGDADNAQEVLAAALCVYPRSRSLRSLYYVASAVGALAKGEVMLATSHLETALAHDEKCTEAAEILDVLRKKGATDNDAMRRLFR